MREYEPVEYLTDGGWVVVQGLAECPTCGAAVANRQAHDDWHQQYGTEPVILAGIASDPDVPDDKCDTFAELTGPGIFHPVSCELPAGHAGPHAVTVTVGDNDVPFDTATIRWQNTSRGSAPLGFTRDVVPAPDGGFHRIGPRKDLP